MACTAAVVLAWVPVTAVLASALLTASSSTVLGVPLDKVSPVTPAVVKVAKSGTVPLLFWA